MLGLVLLSLSLLPCDSFALNNGGVNNTVGVERAERVRSELVLDRMLIGKLV
jgi:hypothetical protein